MSEKKAPKLRFKGYTDDWVQCKLGDVVEYNNGSSYEQIVKSEGQYELITLKSVSSDGKLVSSGKYVSGNFKTLEKNDLIMILSEQAKGMLGVTSVIPCDDKFVLNQRVASLRPYNNTISDFLKEAINTKQALFERLGAGTKVQNIGRKQIENFVITIPTKLEQEIIGSFFKELDSLITLQQLKIDQLNKLKKALLQQLFPEQGSKIPRIRFSQFTDPWEQRKLGDVVKWSKGSGLSKDDINNQKKGEPVIHYADLYKFNPVQNTVIHWALPKNNMSTVIPENNLLFPMSDVTPDGLARTSTILQSNVKAGGDVLIAVLNKNTLSTFMSYQINRNKNQILPLITGTTVRHISSKSLNSLKVFIPRKNEQENISSILIRIDSLITLHQRKLDQLKQVKKFLLQYMFI